MENSTTQKVGRENRFLVLFALLDALPTGRSHGSMIDDRLFIESL